MKGFAFILLNTISSLINISTIQENGDTIQEMRKEKNQMKDCIFACVRIHVLKAINFFR